MLLIHEVHEFDEYYLQYRVTIALSIGVPAVWYILLHCTGWLLYIFIYCCMQVYHSYVIMWHSLQVSFSLAFIYCITEIHVFSFLMFPYSSLLPNVTEKLLNHAIPYNPGGLTQMEQRLGCSFDLNLYAAQRRRQNPLVNKNISKPNTNLNIIFLVSDAIYLHKCSFTWHLYHFSCCKI